MSRTVYLLGVGLALVALALAVTDWALGMRLGVTEANHRRIRPGMALQEVESVLGPRVGDPARLSPFILATVGLGAFEMACAWEGSDGTGAICFGADGRVKDFHFSENRQSTPLARLRAWLSW
jgi:hypothetical protein